MCKEEDSTNSTCFYMYLGAKYMRLPNFLSAWDCTIFWEIPKAYYPLSIFIWDPMASV